MHRTENRAVLADGKLVAAVRAIRLKRGHPLGRARQNDLRLVDLHGVFVAQLDQVGDFDQSLSRPAFVVGMGTQVRAARRQRPPPPPAPASSNIPAASSRILFACVDRPLKFSIQMSISKEQRESVKFYGSDFACWLGSLLATCQSSLRVLPLSKSHKEKACNPPLKVSYEASCAFGTHPSKLGWPTASHSF
jgi:hypothetical protein